MENVKGHIKMPREAGRAGKYQPATESKEKTREQLDNQFTIAK